MVERNEALRPESAPRFSHRHTCDWSRIQPRVICSSERPFVSGMSQATKVIVSNAPAANAQKVPSDPSCFWMIGNNWLPRYPTRQSAVVAIDMPRPRTFVGWISEMMTQHATPLPKA